MKSSIQPASCTQFQHGQESAASHFGVFRAREEIPTCKRSTMGSGVARDLLLKRCFPSPLSTLTLNPVQGGEAGQKYVNDANLRESRSQCSVYSTTENKTCTSSPNASKNDGENLQFNFCRCDDERYFSGEAEAEDCPPVGRYGTVL